jgi:hypothetical protein
MQVRNSWGSAWGEEGYIRLKREAEPGCGTDTTTTGRQHLGVSLWLGRLHQTEEGVRARLWY